MNANITTYTIRCVRGARWWSITCDEIPGIQTQVPRLGQVEKMARSAIVDFLEVPADSFSLVTVTVPPDEVSAALASLGAVSRIAAEANDAARQAQRELVTTAVRAGLPLRDIGSIMHLSHQRVHQILAETDSDRLSA